MQRSNMPLPTAVGRHNASRLTGLGLEILVFASQSYNNPSDFGEKIHNPSTIKVDLGWSVENSDGRGAASDFFLES